MDKIYDDAMNFGKKLFIRMKPIPHGYGKRDNKLTIGHQGQNIFQKMSPSLCHSLGTARRAETAFFTTKRHNMLFAASLTNETKEPKRRDPTLQISLELLENVFR
jgi:hypothetical protein